MATPYEPPRPGLEFLARAEVTLDEVLDLGGTPHGRRRVVPITGGRVDGPRLSADVLPGGADWQILQTGGWVRVEARYTARTDDGLLVSIISRGVRHGPPEVMTALLAGQCPDPSTYRFRTAITFETAEDSPEHAWLNHVVAVSSALRRPDAVVLDVYAIC